MVAVALQLLNVTLRWKARITPGFHHSVAILPLPFRRSVLPFCCTVAALPFRSYVAVARENGITGNVFPYTQGRSDQNADWLSIYGRTANIGFDPILLRNGGYGAKAGGNGNGAAEFFA